MRIAFRVDASSVIGSGHFIRCLTLASALRDAGATCQFVCRAHDGALADQARNAGFAATVLPLRPVVDGDAYAGWVGAPWQDDAAETRHAIGAEKADWIIVDHYGLDARWERDVRASCHHLMVIDDLANRPHDCDLLLDQNLVEGQERRYAGLVPETCGLMLGTAFALLQPSFFELRDRAPPREYPIGRLLVYFGGADRFDLTSRALRAVLALGRRDLAIDVVINPQSHFAPALRELARHHPQVTLHERLKSLAGLMMKADAALGAAGTSSWERCCLGLPTLLVTLAENQRPVAAELDRLGLARWLGDAEVVTSAEIAAAVERLLDDEDLEHWSRRVTKHVDGLGAARVAGYVTLHATTALAARFATTADETLTLQWVNDPQARRHAFSPEAVAAEPHHRWFRARLRDPENCHLLVVTAGAGIIPIGQVRFDRRETNWEISYMLDSRCRGRGLGAVLLATALERFAGLEPAAGCFGRVKSDNIASRRVFERLNFACQDDGEVLTYSLAATTD